MNTNSTRRFLRYALALALAGLVAPALALDGNNYKMVTYNGWDGFEIISYNDNPVGDGFDYAMPSTFDGIGAQVVSDFLRIQVNHELSSGRANISEVVLNMESFKTAIDNVMTNGSGDTGGISFVLSARQAYTRWSADGGMTWNPTTNALSTSFQRFCSGQSYEPNTFGTGRGFVDTLYITGEETTLGRLFVLDLKNSELYQLSGVTGSASSPTGGMPADKWENAAPIDTRESNHIALLLAPDGGSQRMQLYIGEKGKDLNGLASNSFLARNGLAYGSYYYLIDTLPPALGTTSTNGVFSTLSTSALASSKLEDVDTSPTDGTKVVLGDQNSGVFTFEFDLDFSAGAFDVDSSTFTLTKIANHISGTSVLGNADNVDWCGATTLAGTNYPDGLIFVNEDNSSGEVWMMKPDGSEQTPIAGTIPNTESSGILDISELLGYSPGSILLTDNQGGVHSSLSVLINPNATLAPATAFAHFTPTTTHVNFGDIDKPDHLFFSARFVLDEQSDGIDLIEDDMLFSAGPLNINVPAGSFQKRGPHYKWSDEMDGAKIKATLTQYNEESYSFWIQLHGVDLTGWSNPEEWELSIGNDTGKATKWLKGHLQNDNGPHVVPDKKAHSNNGKIN
jgi:hypothetical protein